MCTVQAWCTAVCYSPVLVAFHPVHTRISTSLAQLHPNVFASIYRTGGHSIFTCRHGDGDGKALMAVDMPADTDQ